MILRKTECLQRSIEGFFRERERGQIEWVAGLFLTLFLGVILCAGLQIEKYRAASLYLEDTLAASNLASAVIDVREYGISHSILIADPEEAFGRYRQAVMANLNLDASWTARAGSLVQGKAGIVRYIIYNVGNEEVTVYHFDADGLMTQSRETPGNVTAPNGVPVESTAVYSEITFEVQGMFGGTVKAHKGNLADVSGQGR